MVTRVVHLKREPYDVRIDRSSRLGNPFVIGKDGSREEVIYKHRTRFLKDAIMVEYVLKHCRGKTLGCWCKPKACHGDIYAEVCDRGVWWCSGCLQYHLEPECTAVGKIDGT